MNTYKIYQIVFPSGKVYIGQTKRPIEQRLSEHKNCLKYKKKNKSLILKNAIKKYGFENTKIQILKDNLTLNQANYWEKKYIKQTNNYNMSEGGGHGQYDNPEYRQKLSLAQKGKPRWTDKDKERIRQQRLGTKQSDKTKKLKRDKSSKVWIYNNIKIKDLYNYCKQNNISYWTTRRYAKLLT